MIAAIIGNELLLVAVWIGALIASFALKQKLDSEVSSDSATMAPDRSEIKEAEPETSISKSEVPVDSQPAAPVPAVVPPTDILESQIEITPTTPLGDIESEQLAEEDSARYVQIDEETVEYIYDEDEGEGELEKTPQDSSIDSTQNSQQPLLPIKMSFYQILKFTFQTKKQINAVAKSLQAELSYQSNLLEAKERFAQMTQGINADALGSAAERNIFEASGCALIEVRKGARVSHRESTYSSSGGGVGVRIGPVGVGGGSSSGSSSSTTISYPAPDELTVIDDGGKFIITNLKVSYAGSMFTKTTDFKKIVDYKYKGRQLLIAPRTGSKVWITQFQLLEELWIAVCLIQVALEIDEKRLDAKAKTEYGDAGTAVEFAFKRKLAELDLAYRDSLEEVASFRDTYAKYQQLFPGRVKDLTF